MLCCALAIAALTGCQRRGPVKKLIVIGVDGMDPGFVARHWNHLPNLAKLRSSGSFSRLRTTTPPESPVAWSTFSTGLDPDQHGIYDFVHRDPATHQPFLSTDRTEGPRFSLTLGPYLLPLTGSRVVSLRHGRTFWQTLAERGIPVSVIRIPANYPPVAAGKALAGMGVPDVRGTLGTFTYYTDDPEQTSYDVSGGLIRKVAVQDGHTDLSVEGPPNPLRKDHRFETVRLGVDIDPERPYARIQVGTNAVILREGEWSDWIAANFPLIPHVFSTRGIFRIFAKQLHPGFAMYVSPVNVDPASPALPISQPPAFSKALAQDIGPYGTLGILEDTSALRQGVFDLNEFLTQSRAVLQEESRLLDLSLRDYRDGFLFFYFSSIDQNSHMLWGKHEPELLEIYRAVDAQIGKVMRAQPAAELIVMSDHGFAAFDRAVNLNTWLQDRASPAYAIGLNGLYLTRHDQLESVRQKLLAWRDPVNGRPVVETVTPTHPSPENAAIAPDLIVGYAADYRASWQTALGDKGATELEDNNDAWIADHCIDARQVPGVLFTSPAIPMRDPGLKDLAGAILARFGLESQMR